MRAAPALAALLLLTTALGASPGPRSLQYEDASEGLPEGKPGSSDDAGWTGVRFADVNADGWLDLGAIGRKGNGTQVYLGHGDGTWTRSMQGMSPSFSGRSDLRFGDLDGEGNLDVVDANAKVWLGDGTGAWTAGPQGLPFAGEDVALGDVDNDGDLDAAVVGHLCCGLRVFLNDGAARWTGASAGLPTESGGHKVDLHDLDRDGCLDVVATYWYDGGVWFGDCAGRWTDRSDGLRGFQGWDVEAGDVDGDGALDLVFAVFAAPEGDRGIRVFRGDGARNWTAGAVLRGSESWGGLALEDVDGDGALDLLAGNTCFGSCTAAVRLWLGDGGGGFNEADAGLPVGVDELEGLAAGDVDHNGVWDAGLAHYGEGGVHVWRETSAPARLAVRVLEPLGDERWVGGGLRTIRWAAAIPAGLGPGTVDLAYSTSGPAGPWLPIANRVPNSAAYAWRVPDAQSINAFVRVTLQAGEDSASAANPLPFGLNAGPSAGPRVAVVARASPAQLAPLDAETLQAEARNEGFTRLTGMLRLALTRGGATLLATEGPVDLADGATARLDAAWPSTLADRPGGYAVRATFEGQGETPEGPRAVSRGSGTTFTLVRPWLQLGHNLSAEAGAGEPFRVAFSLSNAGNLPADDVTWTQTLPLAYAPVPDTNRLLRGASAGPQGVLPALFSQPPPADARLDPANQSWVLTYRFPSIGPGAAASIRFDLVPAVPGAWTWATHADYEHHYPHRAEPTRFEATGAPVQRITLG